MKLGETTKDSSLLGHKDAFHVPAVLVWCLNRVRPGDSVRFVKKDKVELCGSFLRDAIVDPFSDPKLAEFFFVIPVPGKVGPVTHSFSVASEFVDPPIPKERDLMKKTEDLEAELNNDFCQGCYD